MSQQAIAIDTAAGACVVVMLALNAPSASTLLPRQLKVGFQTNALFTEPSPKALFPPEESAIGSSNNLPTDKTIINKSHTATLGSACLRPPSKTYSC